MWAAIGARSAVLHCRPRCEPAGDCLQEPLRDCLCDAVEERPVDGPADDAERRLVLCCQGQMCAVGAQSGGSEAIRSVAMDLAHLQPRAPTEVATPHLKPDLEEEPVALVPGCGGHAIEQRVRPAEHGGTKFFEFDRDLRDVLEQHAPARVPGERPLRMAMVPPHG